MKPFDLSKLRKDSTKKYGLVEGFHDPEIWIDTGNFALNALISGDYTKGVPLGKVTVLAGESGSGKSYLAANLMRDCQRKGVLPILLDSEEAMDETWLQALGVDTASDKMMKVNMHFVDQCAEWVNNFVEDYKKQFEGVKKEDRQPILLIIDSLGGLETPTSFEQFKSGDMKGDMGRKPKQLKSFVMNTLKLIGNENIGLVATNHTYASQNMYAPDDVVAGGAGFVYASSIVVQMNKAKLKDEDDKKKILGIRTKLEVTKTRFTKAFEKLELEIPYDTGLSPYSGLFDLFKARGVIEKDGNMWAFAESNGTRHKMYEKHYGPTQFDLIMRDYPATYRLKAQPEADDEVPEDAE